MKKRDIETDSVRALSVSCTYMKAYHLTLQECIHLTKGLSIYLADDLKHLNDSQLENWNALLSLFL